MKQRVRHQEIQKGRETVRCTVQKKGRQRERETKKRERERVLNES
jgi:hypothetical protein